MKKIVFLHTNLNIGGAEIMRQMLLSNIDRKRYNIKVCCIEKKGTLGREIEKFGYEVDELGETPNSLNMGIAFRLAMYLKKEKPDILHSSLFYANFYARIAGWFLSRAPRMITEEHGEHKQYKGIKFLPYILTDFFLSRLNDFIVCCSRELREDIIRKEKLPGNKVMYIENCLDPRRYKVSIGRETLRSRYNIFDEFVFIATASLKAGKGHDHLMDSFRRIKDRGYRFKCFFAGDGPLRKGLEDRSRRLDLSDSVIFLGNVENISDYLNASDAFILYSVSEGLSIALMEGMLMGLPSIVTNTGSNPDLIKIGSNGTLIEYGDREALKNTMIFYLENRPLIKEFGIKARRTIEEEYSSVNDYIKGYYELWNNCFKN